MRSDARTWSTGEARAESTIAEVDIDTGTSPDHTIKAQSLDAVVDTTCSHSVAGVSTIGQLTIDGARYEPVQAQNVILTLGSVVVTRNEISVTGSTGTAQETRTTSLHVVGPNLDVRVSVADAIAAPC
jgi:hypothetical protein